MSEEESATAGFEPDRTHSAATGTDATVPEDYPPEHAVQIPYAPGRRVRRGPVRISHNLREIVGDALRGIREPTQAISVTGSDDAVTQRHARAVIDLCLRTGEAMLATGASAADVVATVLRLSRAYGLTSTHVDVTFTSITISVHRGLDEDPISVMRVVKALTTDYARMQGVLRLVDDITSSEEPMDVDEARTELSAILAQKRPYARWVVTVGKAVLAAGVVTMYDVGPILVAVAALAVVLVDIVTRQLSKLGVSGFFGQIVASSIITWVAVLFYWLRSTGIEIPGSNRPTLIVISGIIMLLSGISFTGAARDAIDGYYVTATARTMEVVMLTLGLAIGISLTLGIAMSIGIPMRVGTTLGPDGGLAWGVLGAGLIGIGFGLTSYAEWRVVWLSGGVAAVVFAFHQAVAPLTNQPGVSSALAGVLAGVIGYLTYRWIKAPEGAISMAGVIGLIPGLWVYRALYAFIDSEYGVNAALPAMVVAFAVGIGLAAGSTIGGYAARRAFGLDRFARASIRRGTRAMR